ncbi:hypothetical protein [Streptomyces gibsoniae]|uniref:Type VII secretion protein EccE n=1 Tax=Streptomyces gibsoniae TaxID=3075529 RepID=A0ABU2TPT7_9ACTN|nr:hypothetical protein [Streptomyces sp. DSM 41699]MDT0462964.1 hypothetical protein [Streptomyces sp. DSM 41699]
MTAGGGLTAWFGPAGAVILVAAVTHWLVKRAGGWKVMRRRVRNEVRLTARAFAQPVRTEARYRSRLRLLVRLLRDPGLWADAERAVAMAATVDPAARPYGLLAGPHLLGVLMTARTADGSLPPVPPEPWAADPTDPLLWWVSRSDVLDLPGAVDVNGAPGVPETATVAPLLVCVGTDGRHAVLLDLYAGPPAVSVYGAPREARAVLQALAAQLEARLPAGTVAVSSGVHPRYEGLPAAEIVDLPGIGFAVLADPVDRPLPDGVRQLTLGHPRGRARLLAADAGGMLTVHGAVPIERIDVMPLSRAVVKVLHTLPPLPESGGPDREPPLPAAPVTHVLPPSAGGGASDDDLSESDVTFGAGSAPAVVRTDASAARGASAGSADDDLGDLTEADPGEFGSPVELAASAAGDLTDLSEPTTSGTAGVSAASPTHRRTDGTL